MILETWSLTGSYFHFGEQGLGQEKTRAFWSSDSLFSALAARLAVLKGEAEVQRWLQPFCDDRPPFLLTSLFPLAGNLRFFSVPLAATLPADKPLPKDVRLKDLKRAQFVSESLYRQLLGGKSLAEIEPGASKVQGGKVWLTPIEHEALIKSLGKNCQIWQVVKRPRVTVERSSNASNLFHVGAVHFASGCGLWFGVQWLDAAADKTLFEQLLIDLGDAGLGAERSTGYGKGAFTSSGTLQLPDPKGWWTSLSRYLPRQDEMDAFGLVGTAWKVQTVSGWLDSPQKSGQRRRAINLVQEGATLRMPASGIPLGRLADVRPRYQGDLEYPVTHPVYRSGFAVAVGYGGEV